LRATDGRPPRRCHVVAHVVAHVVGRTIGAATLRIAAGIALVAASTACGGPAVTLRLVAGEGLAVPPEFLRLVFRPAEGEAIETDVFTSLALPDNAFAAIPPGVVFSVDVIGCKTNVAEDCVDEDSFVARGCAGNLVRGRDEPLEVEVPVHSAVVGNPLCPIEAPER
jgi:hypothetical protein